MFKKEVMVRVEKTSKEEIEREEKNLKERFTIADQIVPLIFNRNGAKLLYCLAYASEMGLDIGNLQTLERLAEVDHTQETIDRLNYMNRCALLHRTNGGYEATEMGASCGKFVDKLTKSVWYEEYARKYEGLPVFGTEKFPEQRYLAESLEKIRKNVNFHLSQRRAREFS